MGNVSLCCIVMKIQYSKWSSEEIVIPYRSPIDKKVHRYFPDFWIQLLNSKGIKRRIFL